MNYEKEYLAALRTIREMSKENVQIRDELNLYKSIYGPIQETESIVHIYG